MLTTITFIISIIGCVTGLTSILIQFFNYLRFKPRIGFLKPDIYKNWAVESFTGHRIGYLEDENGHAISFSGHDDYVFFVLPVVIINKSGSPISIFNVSPKGENGDFSSVFKYHLDSIPLKDGSGGRYIYNQLPIFDFPIRINSYDSVSGSVVVYFLNNEIPNLESIEVKFQTTSGNFSYKAKHIEKYGSV